jgi:choline dehydrogenase-like flavoprotein
MTFATDGTLRALVDRLLPADETPSGWQVGVGDFIDRILATDLAPQVVLVRAGLAGLNAEARARGESAGFAGLSDVDQDALIEDLLHDRARTAWPESTPVAFVQLLIRLTAQGYYGDPGNGGNRDATSWRQLGYQERPEGRDWPAGEAQPQPTVAVDQISAHYDAVVVGAGAGGGVAACVLAEAGWRVLLVERGEWLTSAKLRPDHLRNQRSIFGYRTPASIPTDGNPRVLATSSGPVTVDPTDGRWSANASAIGGGTRVYGAQGWRFAPEDFSMATVYGVPGGSSLADWPISYDELAPWYDRAEWEWGVAGDPAGDRAAGPRARGFPMPPVEANLGAAVLARGASRLGLVTGPVPLLINSEPRDGRGACIRCGVCVGFACPGGAKNGAHNTVIPRAVGTGRCDVVVRSQVARISTDPDGTVTGVVLVGEDEAGQWRREVRAEQVVLAAGAIETARLLLNSPTAAEPGGLGNGHDQVGRNLQAHVYAGAIGLFDDVVQDSVGPGPSISTNDFRHHNESVIGGGMLANDFVPTPVNVWDTLSRLGVVPAWGLAGKQGLRTLWSRMQLVFGPAQEIPNPDSRVQVDPQVLDRFGLPVARLSGDIHPEDRRTADFLAMRAAEWLRASGAHTVIAVNADDRPAEPSGGQHQAGTCRMGTDPRSSVTDSWGRVWGHPNLLIADGSVHVTNGGVNPVLTIIALAYRNATRLVRTTSPRGEQT